VLTDPSGAQQVAVAVPVLVVDDPRLPLGAVSALIYGDPAARMRSFGVTGTNGKTTVTYMLAAALEALGMPAGLIGTTGTWMQGRRLPTVRTTPEAPDVHALLSIMAAAGMTAVAMEVSSHALTLSRVDGITFDVAGFTNLTPDHLDFHETMEHYFEAKAELFTAGRSRLAVVNIDDEWGRRLAGRVDIPTTTYGFADDADWTVRDLRSGAAGSRFSASGPETTVDVAVRAPGAFNAANALAALVMLVESGQPAESAAEAIGAFHGVPGRMEVVSAPGSGVTVIVDYAHTPDAVERALAAVRPLTHGRIWCVLGCGGDRDAHKRPAMGRIGATYSDHLVVTDDNPRSEEPSVIRAAVLEGARHTAEANVEEIGDRAQAITATITAASDGDTVMILGKGHETGQEVAGVMHPFDDRIVAREAMEAAR
jgi:UDP-N-acetylmuramoyl-L-alanyl-D-glutamate--2,6-diaminopimelate ligase